MTYDEMLNFNKLISWIHSRRYNQTNNYLKSLSKFNQPIRVMEIGCANARLFGVFHDKYPMNYVGIEVDQHFYEEATQKYGAHSNFAIHRGDAANPASYPADAQRPDIVICLETFEHMPKQTVIETLNNIKKLNPKIFICSVPVEHGLPVLIKNTISWLFGYHRHKNYSFSELYWSVAGRFDKLPAHAGCHKGFDWRWLKEQIKVVYPQAKIQSIPASFLPTWLANSVFFVAGT